jgi:hypothetical protein
VGEAAYPSLSTRLPIVRRIGLPERLLAILVLMAVIDFGQCGPVRPGQQFRALRSDDAARIAENLTIASRALEAEARRAPRPWPRSCRRRTLR